eukprot:TRINITY_DN67949_c5_g5_i4.p1 TRINITY_DN67949_c5_g5~~TRINITY_DN67949_c5_g5_i4.p1  ORF type:complete len:231 (-),score=24.54 TRINITY_DN67949_c5_g5_i4:417-1109(-)
MYHSANYIACVRSVVKTHNNVGLVGKLWARNDKEGIDDRVAVRAKYYCWSYPNPHYYTTKVDGVEFTTPNVQPAECLTTVQEQNQLEHSGLKKRLVSLLECGHEYSSWEQWYEILQAASEDDRISNSRWLVLLCVTAKVLEDAECVDPTAPVVPVAWLTFVGDDPANHKQTRQTQLPTCNPNHATSGSEHCPEYQFQGSKLTKQSRVKRKEKQNKAIHQRRDHKYSQGSL